ncbi:DUF1769-domain-containing protein [Lophiostoma macrostomum CBS 122681]|uniref:DUF1769-domain-containing protein n=1 Tax=Lophiostoma macrostomum CBS 122681 TaxID=1314788 RepID=A0A6A6TFL9_9PLEO|nr:DUF1769-domain-containing protein [Lophiostoma macrostomum CBS 122681]
MGRSEDGVVDPAARDQYLLQVTAGPSYDASTHTTVAVNGTSPHTIENDLMTCYLSVKIRDYHGLPQNSPSTSPYFSHPMHASDRYSIGFSFVPKKDIPGKDLVTGFDFDHSIKDRLPPGFRYAMRIVTTMLDPGIYSDAYSNKPYLYGPALSSFFTFRIGEHTSHESVESQLATMKSDSENVIQEGADGSGQRIRADLKIPSKSSKRRKNFLKPDSLEGFTFEAGRLYQADFFNPYLDFANFALRIPGFSISVVKYIDNKTHQLRYVLKNRATEEVLFVVIFTLLFGQKLEEARAEEAGETREGTEATIAVEKQTSERGRPQTSSSSETPAPSSRSSSAASDTSDGEREGRPAATSLASSIYSGFAYLGFGRTASSSESSSVSSSPERQKKTLNERVDDMDASKMEEYLKNKHSNAA